jgi:hypothetical protein
MDEMKALTLRSHGQQGVLRSSKDEGWQQAQPSKWPSFETRRKDAALLRMR